ncbi:hypothetical protein BDZ89DRAFT_590353 [Hymenopellis radicata]|nr:hypothetical protein BDZ89DRAFT_590353 [Hymenopellis radicata]
MVRKHCRARIEVRTSSLWTVALEAEGWQKYGLTHLTTYMECKLYICPYLLAIDLGSLQTKGFFRNRQSTVIGCLTGALIYRTFVKDLKVQVRILSMRRRKQPQMRLNVEDKAADGTERKLRKLVKDEHRETGGKYLQVVLVNPAYLPSDNLENLVVKYAPELPAVLHDVSFTFRAGKRIGRLGRT